MAMDPDLKNKWVEALRSGKYQQGEYRLLGNEGYCCLGVLAKISGKYEDPELSDRSFLQPERSFGLDNLTQNTLSMMNDMSKMSFAEIADWVEANL